MLQVLPVQEKEKQRELCEMLGIEYDPDQMCYAAHEGDELRGISLFGITGKHCVIYKVKTVQKVDDRLALYLLAKAPLNFCDLCGIKKAVFKDSENTELAKELEFTEKDGVYVLNLDGYFTSPCHRHEKNGDGR